MRPAITACTPPYRPYSSEPKMPTMRNAVSIARVPVRRIEVAKARSLASENLRVSAPSCVKLCTTGTAFSTSPAIALESAMRSWLARDSRRTRPPISIAGATTSTMMPTTVSISRGLVAISIAMPPTNSTALRSPIETLDPTALWITVVSVVRRDSTSPVFSVSKNCGLCVSTCA